MLDGDVWVITGQKVWTSLAHVADWCFVLARTDPASPRHAGCLPARADGPARRRGPARSCSSPARRSSTRSSSTAPRTAADDVVGEPGDGWRVAMGTARLRARRRHARPAGRLRPRARRRDRGCARASGAVDDPVSARPARRRLGRAADHAPPRAAHAGHAGGRRRRGGRRSPSCSGRRGTSASASWRWSVARAAASLAGGRAVRADRRAAAVPVHPRRHHLRRLNEIQRNVLAERILGLPRDRA